MKYTLHNTNYTWYFTYVKYSSISVLYIFILYNYGCQKLYYVNFKIGRFMSSERIPIEADYNYPGQCTVYTRHSSLCIILVHRCNITKVSL